MEQLLAQATVNGLSSGIFYVLIALGFTLIFSIQRIINFAHGEFYTIGGYLYYVFTVQIGLPIYISILFAVAGGMILGGFISRFYIEKIKGDPLNNLIGTLGLSLVLSSLLLIIFGAMAIPRTPVIGEGVTFDLGFVVITRTKVYLMLISFLATAFFMWIIMKTWTGKALRAITQDPEMALVHGIQVKRYNTLGFAIGCGLPALAGALLGPMYLIYPYSGEQALLYSFIVVILGGLGSIPGAIVGGLLMGLLEAYTTVFISPQFSSLIGFFVIILLLVFRPQGLFGVSVRRY
ncbi:branched-chain amino acid ABC transporter permease [Bacillus sp. FJAT-50079]|uniref:branched-chain amino acid ABC transporter permease n=1 Tax=Bacillus sp. FJAT-50079 TaxID=2833577 RepID=UPI001BC8FE2E|nr:branched-chain amino acid ABC transporter permease [Bacillus sp. FJAT-50079]MBS4210589.1 branched-chain amino acid ABC transporter permease [Bacillus sp. FJAT-50079]